MAAIEIVYSGNKAGWLTQVANAIMDGGDNPPSIGHLINVVPSRVGTERNDGHVTAAENGLDRNDYRGGYRIWVEGCVEALRKAKLVAGDDSALRWVGDVTKNHQVPFANNLVTVFGKPQRLQNRARHLLGKADDYMVPGLGPGGFIRGDSAPLTVKVRTHWHGGERIHEQKLSVHPLALAIPPMNDAEIAETLADIGEHGVRVPILLYPDPKDLSVKGKPKPKILDGRHRAVFASLTDQPVEVEDFAGTEQEARDLVASLNLRRRNLTRQQLALASERLYGDWSRQEAKKAMAAGGASSAPGRPAEKGRKKLTEVMEDGNPGPRSFERTWKAAGGETSGFSKADAKVMEIVAKAPITAARVEAGEIRNTAEAKREAQKEIAGEVDRPKDRSAGSAVSAPKPAFTRLGAAVYELKMLEMEWPGDGRADPDQLRSRLNEIIERARRLLGLLSPE